MEYLIIRNKNYDFVGQSYASLYPNLHKYPATMLPQIGIKILNELGIRKGKLLDPYCGTGSTFIAGLDNNIKEMEGYDLNPLAVLIASAKYTTVNLEKVLKLKQRLRNAIFEFVKDELNLNKLKQPDIYNKYFWYSENVLQNLSIIKFFIDKIKEKEIRMLFLVPFSETVRLCSYTRNDEFKLYRMKPDEILKFNPDVFGVYFDKLNKAIEIYEKHYFPKLKNTSINVNNRIFSKKIKNFDVVLTSPPYGDSRTTVAYGEFSTFSNEWLGFKNARAVDKNLMGGRSVKEINITGLLEEPINLIKKESEERALQVCSFYKDLGDSIADVAYSVKKGGRSIYVVGNRKVKNVELPTDQFIAEKFEKNGFKHLFTYKRILSNKVMPSKNSPSNIKGETKNTMKYEYIVVCEKFR